MKENSSLEPKGQQFLPNWRLALRFFPLKWTKLKFASKMVQGGSVSISWMDFRTNQSSFSFAFEIIPYHESDNNDLNIPVHCSWNRNDCLGPIQKGRVVCPFTNQNWWFLICKQRYSHDCNRRVVFHEDWKFLPRKIVNTNFLGNCPWGVKLILPKQFKLLPRTPFSNLKFGGRSLKLPVLMVFSLIPKFWCFVIFFFNLKGGMVLKPFSGGKVVILNGRPL